jgi:hypothetical protein
MHGQLLHDAVHVERVCTDGSGYITTKYSELVQVFITTKAETLALYRPIDHAIDINPGNQLPSGRIYNVS